MPNYTPHSDEEIATMCEFLGIDSVDQLFDAIPKALQVIGQLDLDEGMSEPDVLATMKELARGNTGAASAMVCFAGAGAYDHEVPPVVKALGSRSEFVTAYTPYQPEVAQGVLQAIFEFQTMVARLTGLPVSNASLYDGAASIVEALNLATAATKNQRVEMSSGVHPHWRAVAKTFARGTGHEITELPLVNGVTDFSGASSGNPGVIVVSYPTFLGTLDDLAAVRARCDETGALMVVSIDPIMAGVLKTAGDWGADIVVGEGQPLGTALSYGGPYLGLFACAIDQVRRLPGRLVGETVDVDGHTAYVTTLRAREQDIRREKATSNVCSNQTLMAVVAAIQLGWLGRQGLVEVANRSVNATHYAADEMLAIDGVDLLFPATPFTRDVAIVTPLNATALLDQLADEGFLGGLALSALVGDDDQSVPSDVRDRVLIISATEKRTKTEIDSLVVAMRKAVVQ